MLKPASRFAAIILLCAVHAGLAQPRLSLALTGGLQVYPSREKYHFPLLGASAWYQMNKKIFLSGEYVRYPGVDVYPIRVNGLLPARVYDNSNTQRIALGLHHPVKIYNHSSVALLGINFGQSRERRGYQLYEPTIDGSFNYYGTKTDHLQRAVLYGSLTALSQNKKLPFFLQTRYGFSFNSFFDASKSFLQVIAGIHLGVL